MLNRFQFSRLRAFRFGGRKNTAGAGRDQRSAGSQGEVAQESVRDSWEGDDRVERLLERRAAAQEAERRGAVERLSASGTTAATAAPPAPTRPAPTPEQRRPWRQPWSPPGPPRTATRPLVRAGVEPKPRRGAGAAVGTSSARVVCIASGKGGTGKSVLASNLAVLWSQRGERVLLVDFDAGLANAHLLLGLAPPHDVGHVMEGQVTAQEALVEGLTASSCSQAGSVVRR